MTRDRITQILPNWEKETPWMEILTADRISPLKYEINGKTMFIGPWRGAIRDIQLEDQVRRIDWIIPSLVKNFMVMVRTLPDVGGDSLKILVRGSRAYHGGGQWDAQYAQWLSLKWRRVRVDLYDIHELPGEVTYKYGNSRVTVRRIRSYYEGNGSEYDMAVDDAYMGTGVPEWDVKAKIYSRKRLHGTHDVYLHSHEGREFSETKEQVLSIQCSCTLCMAQSINCEDVRQYYFLHALCVELGASPCISVHSHIVRKSEMFIEMTKVPVVPKNLGEQRLVASIAIKHPIQEREGSYTVAGSTFISPTLPLFSMKGSTAAKGWWKGVMVSFVGVSPSILGAEDYVRSTPTLSSFISDPSVHAFINSLHDLSSYAVVWAKFDPPGFVSTNREHEGYKEFKRKRLFMIDKSYKIEEIVVPVVEEEPTFGLEYTKYPEGPCDKPICMISDNVPRPCSNHSLIKWDLNLSFEGKRKWKKKKDGVYYTGDNICRFDDKVYELYVVGSHYPGPSLFKM